MIFMEFPVCLVEQGRVPATLCQFNDNANVIKYMQFADKAYALSGGWMVVLKNRCGNTDDYKISREDAVALTLKAVVL